MYANHKSIKSIKTCRPIRTQRAVELCAHCGLEWNKPASFNEIPKIEKKIAANILMLDMEQIPVLQATSSIYNSLMYENDEMKSNQQSWLLHDNDHYINYIGPFFGTPHPTPPRQTQAGKLNYIGPCFGTPHPTPPKQK